MTGEAPGGNRAESPPRGPPPRSGMAKSPDGVGLHWSLFEASAARARLLLVPGFGDNAARYEEFARSLADRGVTVMTYDQRGNGRSQGPRGDIPSFDRLILDLRLLLDHLRSEPSAKPLPTFLLGHSMGGLVVLRFLQGRPRNVSGAVLSSPWLATAFAVPAWKMAAAHILRWIAPGLPVPNQIPVEKLTGDVERMESHGDEDLVHNRVTPRLFWAVRRAQRELREGTRRIALPLLFLVPEGDQVVDSPTTFAFVRSLEGGGAVLRRLEGFQHDVWNDLGREDLYRMVGEWIGRRLAGGTAGGPDGPA